MKLDLSFDDAEDYLLVRVKGDWTREGVMAGIRDAAQRAQEVGQTRILLDIRELSAPKADMDRFMAGESIAKVFPFPCKVVAVRSADLIDKFAENVAVNRGAKAIVLSDINEAVRWLTKDPTQ
jgi:hypothetical protein